MQECDNITRKIRISNNFILSISLLIMFDTLLLKYFFQNKRGRDEKKELYLVHRFNNHSKTTILVQDEILKKKRAWKAFKNVCRNFLGN